MTREAKLIARGAHRDWICPTPSCNKLLAKVHEDHVVVRSGNVYATFPIDAPVRLTCPKCLTETAIAPEVVAA